VDFTKIDGKEKVNKQKQLKALNNGHLYINLTAVAK
jgi:hypothetical protein